MDFLATINEQSVLLHVPATTQDTTYVAVIEPDVDDHTGGIQPSIRSNGDIDSITPTGDKSLNVICILDLQEEINKVGDLFHWEEAKVEEAVAVSSPAAMTAYDAIYAKVMNVGVANPDEAAITADTVAKASVLVASAIFIAMSTRAVFRGSPSTTAFAAVSKIVALYLLTVDFACSVAAATPITFDHTQDLVRQAIDIYRCVYDDARLAGIYFGDACVLAELAATAVAAIFRSVRDAIYCNAPLTVPTSIASAVVSNAISVFTKVYLFLRVGGTFDKQAATDTAFAAALVAHGECFAFHAGAYNDYSTAGVPPVKASELALAACKAVIATCESFYSHCFAYFVCVHPTRVTRAEAANAAALAFKAISRCCSKTHHDVYIACLGARVTPDDAAKLTLIAVNVIDHVYPAVYDMVIKAPDIANNDSVVAKEIEFVFEHSRGAISATACLVIETDGDTANYATAAAKAVGDACRAIDFKAVADAISVSATSSNAANEAFTVADAVIDAYRRFCVDAIGRTAEDARTRS